MILAHLNESIWIERVEPRVPDIENIRTFFGDDHTNASRPHASLFFIMHRFRIDLVVCFVQTFLDEGAHSFIFTKIWRLHEFFINTIDSDMARDFAGLAAANAIANNS